MEVIHNERISKKPLYVQVYDILAHRISRGILPDGTYLANEYDLSREMNVSIGTIRKAVDLLTEAQLVIRQQGKGTLVSDRRWLAIREKLNRIRFGEDAAIAAWSSERLSYEKQPAGEQLAAILQIEPADEVHRLNNLWTAHPKAVADVVSYIPIAVISDFPANDENIQTTTGI
ncbi:MAG: GntR family transcriptional regulator, partial [Hyphomicrobiales bacterium]|nr:GntR family transcriptional regulator [Hyphomicrobiales bacterium]